MHRKTVWMSLLFALPLSAMAEVTLSGFGSVVAGAAEDLGFRYNDYADVSLKPQTRLAIQGSADIAQDLSATVQLLAKGTDDFEAQFEWAYLSYSASDSALIRIGRLRIPFYRYSDYLDVGYAQPFISPPKAMYNLTFSTYEGISVLHSLSIDEVDLNLNFIGGRLEDSFFNTTAPTKGSLSNILGINGQASWGDLTFYGTYIRADVTIPVPTIEGLVTQLNAAGIGTRVTDQLRIRDDNGTFMGLGLNYDDGTWILNLERARVDVENALYNASQHWYVHAAYRIRSVMPYLYYGELDTLRTTGTAALFPAPFRDSIQAAFDSQMVAFSEAGLGVRWDFHDSAAVKLEVTRFADIWDRDPVTALGSANHKEKMAQLRVGVDFVF